MLVCLEPSPQTMMRLVPVDNLQSGESGMANCTRVPPQKKKNYVGSRQACSSHCATCASTALSPSVSRTIAVSDLECHMPPLYHPLISVSMYYLYDLLRGLVLSMHKSLASS
jgi:hypothetical protein